MEIFGVAHAFFDHCPAQAVVVQDPLKGVGKFLVKLGGLPGIPVNVQMCDIERSGFNDTNAKWSR